MWWCVAIAANSHGHVIHPNGLRQAGSPRNPSESHFFDGLRVEALPSADYRGQHYGEIGRSLLGASKGAQAMVQKDTVVPKAGIRHQPMSSIDVSRLIAEAQRAYDALLARRTSAELRASADTKRVSVRPD
jgi:hypothetical protein